LSELLSRYPQSPFYAQALFYKGKCLSEQKGKEFQAWQTFEEFLKRQDMPEGLVEEPELPVSIWLLLFTKRADKFRSDTD